MNRDTSVNNRVGSELKNWGSISGNGTEFPTDHCAQTGLKTAKKEIRQDFRERGGVCRKFANELESNCWMSHIAAV